MFSSSSLVKLIVFEKQKTGKTNKNSTNTGEQSTVAAICGAITSIVNMDNLWIISIKKLRNTGCKIQVHLVPTCDSFLYFLSLPCFPNTLPIQFKLRNLVHLKQRFLKISGKKIINVTLFFFLTPAPIPREALIPVPSGVGVIEGVSGLSPSRWALFPHRRPMISDQHKPPHALEERKSNSFIHIH